MRPFKLSRGLLPTGVLLFFLLVYPNALARADELPRGTLIERVRCEADTTQSYSLYLPSLYTPQKKWPVIYAFDPGARGDVPVKLYQEAAEKYGYIIAGSYNSQNGMQTAPLNVAITSLINDTRKRFSIDERRIYTTGFSGGARVATRIASSCGGCVAGVIACGAGFPSDIKPSTSVGFVFYGTVGLEDYNYPELVRLEERLTELKIQNHLATFNGDHRWASSQFLVEAVEWMELQAMREGRRERDEALITALWKKRVEDASPFAVGVDAYAAFRNYEALVDDFRSLKNVTEHETIASRLKEMKEVKQAFRSVQDQLREQQEIADRLISLGSRLLAEPSIRAVAMKELKSAVEALRKKARNSADPVERLVATRSLSQVLAQTFEAALYNYLPNRQYDVAIVNLLVAEEIKPELVRIPYELARAYAVTGAKGMAVESLRRAVKKGLTDASAIENQKDFDAIRLEKGFRLIVDELMHVKSLKR